MSETETPTGDYDTDVYGWAMHQAALLRQGRVCEVEIDHLAQEMEELGLSQYDKLESALRGLLLHMLKWDYQPGHRSRSWALTILEQRRRLDRALAKNPSLKPRRAEATDAAWGDARLGAARETGLPLPTFPEQPNYSWDDITQRAFAITD